MGKSIGQNTLEAVEPPAGKVGFSLIPDEKLIEIYAAMAKCRMFEERARLLFQQGRLAHGMDASAGREASTAAIVVDLLPGDALSPSQRDMLPSFLKGVPLERLFRSLATNGGSENRLPATPRQNGFAAKNVLAAPSNVAAQLGAACDLARGYRKKKSGNIAVAFIEDETASHDELRAPLTQAKTHKLPVLFVRYGEFPGHVEVDSEADPASRRVQKNLEADFHEADIEAETLIHGIPAIVVDGTDAVAIYRVAFEANARARQGRGPTLVECKAYRRAGRPLDPLLNMETYLKRKGLFSETLKPKIAESFGLELDLATRFLND